MINLANLKTPGVYIDEAPTLPSSIVGVETAIPAFIGYVEKMVINGRDWIDEENREFNAVKIYSPKQYEDIFGGPLASETKMEVHIDETGRVETSKWISEGANIYVGSVSVQPKFLMYHQLQMFFANGGGPCYIVPVGKYPIGTPDKDKMAEALTNTVATLDEPTLIIFPDAVSLSATDMYSLYQEGLKQCFDLKDRFTLIDLENNKNAEVNFRGDEGIGNSKDLLRYGAAYHPWLKTGLKYAYQDANITIKHKKNGNEASPLKKETEGAESTPTPDKIGFNDQNLAAIPISNTFYSQIKQAIEKKRMILPPSSAIAGIYAFVDNARGVWKAPANVGLSNVNGLTFYYTDEEQKNLNADLEGGKSINIIRSFTGRGIVVWGARTLDGNDNEWRYVNVRRFFNYVEESVKKAMNHYVFEPNDANTWVKVKASIESFLRLQWQAGALQGAKPEQAFFVRVGLGETMSSDDILNGRMIVEIGLAVVRPAEFIVLRFMHKLAEA